MYVRVGGGLAAVRRRPGTVAIVAPAVRRRPGLGLLVVAPPVRRFGLGASDDYYASDCPAGTVAIGSGCYREAGSQQTPWGVVSVPDPGPSTDLAAAEAAARAAGINLSCRRESVGVGPYAYAQDICSVPGYSEGFDAALIAQPGGLDILRGNLAQMTQSPGSSYFSNPTLQTGQIVTIQSPNAPAAPAAVNAAAGGAAAPATATITNTGRPGYGFQVGDTFQLVLTGPANSQVSGSATQNGRSLGTTPYGTTDQNGRLVLTGSMDEGTVGTWRELWTVGTSPAPVLEFTVAARPAAVASPGGNGAAGGAANDAFGNDMVEPPAAGFSLADFLKSSFSVGGVSVPYWAAGLAGVGLLMFSGGRK